MNQEVWVQVPLAAPYLSTTYGQTLTPGKKELGLNPWNETERIGTVAAEKGAAGGKETKGTVSQVS